MLVQEQFHHLLAFGLTSDVGFLVGYLTQGMLVLNLNPIPFVCLFLKAYQLLFFLVFSVLGLVRHHLFFLGRKD